MNVGPIGVTSLFTTGFIKLIYSRFRLSPKDQLAVDEKTIRLHGQQFWLYGVVDPYTNEILHVSLYSTANKQMTRWFLTELHRHYQLNNVGFFVDDADYLGSFLLKTAIDIKSFSMEIKMLLNMSFGK